MPETMHFYKFETSVYNKCNDFEFPIVNFPWLICDAPFEFIFRSRFYLLEVVHVQVLFILILSIFKSLITTCINTGLQISKHSENVLNVL